MQNAEILNCYAWKATFADMFANESRGFMVVTHNDPIWMVIIKGCFSSRTWQKMFCLGGEINVGPQKNVKGKKYNLGINEKQ